MGLCRFALFSQRSFTHSWLSIGCATACSPGCDSGYCDAGSDACVLPPAVQTFPGLTITYKVGADEATGKGTFSAVVEYEGMMYSQQFCVFFWLSLLNNIAVNLATTRPRMGWLWNQPRRKNGGFPSNHWPSR